MTILASALEPPEVIDGRPYNVQMSLAFSLFDSMRYWCRDSCDQCMNEECEENCDAGVWYDHLVIQSLDGPPYSLGRAVISYDLLDPHYNGRVGQWGYTHTCICSPNPDPPPDSSCRYVWDQINIEHGDAGPVYLNIPYCGRWRIHYVMDDRDWDVFCVDEFNTWPAWGGVPTRVIKNLGDDGRSSCEYYPNLVNHIMTFPETHRTFADVDLDSCYEHPPGDAHLKFIGYVDPRGGNGEQWLPEPGDSIGLAFSINSETGGRYRISYGIWDVSMWQGQCLNSPRFAPIPRPTGWSGFIATKQLDTLKCWDMMVCRPERYRLICYDTVRTYSGWQPPGMPVEREVFRSTLIATTESEVSQDTLWLKARDYAAHCLVTPIIVDGGGKDNMFVEDFLSPYSDERLNTITVPYDYDGLTGLDHPIYANPGVNYGDGMADYWEFAAFHLTDPKAVRGIMPFVITPPTGPPAILADNDSLPKGRDIRGDYLCNFEEYRGLMVAADCTDTWMGHRFQRTDPIRKSTIVHVRGNLEDETRISIPGYVYKIPGAETYFSDSIRWGPDQSWDDRAEERRLSVFWRDMNYNKAGASRWHFGYSLPTSKPVPDTSEAHAITFWRFRDSPDTSNFGPRTLGKTYGINTFWDPASSSWAYIPRVTSRCVVASDRISAFQLNTYYQAHPDSFWVDFPRVMSKVIAHEFGHGIGMHHLPPDQDLRTIMDVVRTETNHRLVTEDSLYSNPSLGQLSIKQRNP